jgi:thiol-disulfide isomerase/thioredoxin
MAEGELFESRHLKPGKEAPEMAGEDLEGKRLKLSDYRGKVVVVVSWTTWCSPCRTMFPHERALAQKFAGKPFALLGVNGDADRDKAKEMAATERLSWPTFWDGDRGPIVAKWRLRWPTAYVLDDKGIIRRKYIGMPAEGQLARDVDDLLRKMEATRPARQPNDPR